jgi:S-formylglutathione hydrolase FrmB
MAACLFAAVTAAAVHLAAHHSRPPVQPRVAAVHRPPLRPTAGTVSVIAVPAPDAPGGARKVWIYRPGVPDSRSLPVVYFLHGLPGSYLDIASIGGKSMLDDLITTGTVKPFVLAAPDGASTRAADPEWADSADGKQLIESFIVNDLTRVVEGSERRDRAHRAIVGFSMGGYGAMNIGLQHPDLYGAVAAISGYFDTDDESGVFGGNPGVIASNRPDRHVTAARGMRVMLTEGASDLTAVTQGEVTRFSRLLRAVGVSPLVDIQPGGHDMAYLRRELPRVLSFLVDGHV